MFFSNFIRYSAWLSLFASGFGIIASGSLSIVPGGQSSLTVDQRKVNLSLDGSGFMSSLDNGLGALGQGATFDVEDKVLYSETTGNNRAGAAGRNVVRTYYDSSGRVVKLRHPGADGSAVTETWTYDDANRSVTHDPGAGPVSQTMQTSLSVDGATLTMMKGGKNFIQKVRSVKDRSVVMTTSLYDDTGNNGAQLKSVTAETVNPAQNATTFTPWNLDDAHSVKLAQSVAQTTMTNGLTGDGVTTTISNGLPSQMSGTVKGMAVSMDLKAANGIMTSASGKIGGMNAGVTTDVNGRVTEYSGPGFDKKLTYGNDGSGGYTTQVQDTVQGTTGSTASTSVGDPVSVNDPHALSLSMTAVDTQSGSKITLNGSVTVNLNLAGDLIGKTYSGGAITESRTLNADGSLAAYTTGSGTGATITQTPQHSSTVYTDGEDVEEDFYDAGPRKSVTGPDDGRTFIYQNLQLEKETHTAGPWAGWAVEWKQDPQGRLGTLEITKGDVVQRHFMYTYDGYSRLASSKGDGVTPANEVDATYTRDGAGHITGFNRGSVNTTSVYDPTLGRLQSVTNANPSGMDFSYTYGQYDQRGRLLQRSANPGVSWSGITYDGIDQLKGCYLSTGKTANYSYDGRGNRVGQAPGNVTQTANVLDQVTSRTVGSRGFGMQGSVTPAAQLMVLTSMLPAWQSVSVDPVTGNFFAWWDVASGYIGGAAAVITGTVRGTLPGAGANGANAVADADMTWVVPPTQENLKYDGSGNLLEDAYLSYSWNAAGRMIQTVRKPGTYKEAGEDGEWTVMTYDAEGRRTLKVHNVTYNVAPVKVEYSQVLYAGKLPILEVRYTNTQSLGRRWFQWGVDRSGTFDAAGGIGGLVAILEEDDNGALVRKLLPMYDGKGNITGVINAATGQLVARYDYGPFGELLVAWGEVDACPFRWQTQWFDSESQQIHFLYRDYDPRLDRWTSRDPIGEAGGFNLYSYCGNDPVNRWDYLGMDIDSEGSREGLVELSKLMWRFASGSVKAVSPFVKALSGSPEGEGAIQDVLRSVAPIPGAYQDVSPEQEIAGLKRSVTTPEGFGALSVGMFLGRRLPGFLEEERFGGQFEDITTKGAASILHRKWGSDLDRINNTISKLGQRAVDSNRNWQKAEHQFESYIEMANDRLARVGSRFRIEMQPAASPGIGRVPAFETEDIATFGMRPIPGSYRLDAGVIDISTEGYDYLQPLLSGFDISVNPFKPPVMEKYQRVFGDIPIFDIRPSRFQAAPSNARSPVMLDALPD